MVRNGNSADMIDDFFWYLIHVEQTVRNGNSADMIDDSFWYLIHVEQTVRNGNSADMIENQVPERIIYHVCTVTVSNRLFYMNQVPQKLF
jgi:hypothetical protein